MTDRSPMHQQIDTLPALVRDIAQTFDASASTKFSAAYPAGARWVSAFVSCVIAGAKQ